ncbi:MAG TPA: SDR family oxidoreductase [Terriglobales bacterium]|nr:SDR family oxidoreductase [Terriglobales bacterium]
MDLGGKVALITGARRGIGAATADALEAMGARVARHQRQGGDFAADLSQVNAAAGLIEKVLQRFGRLDFLVNNAALTPLGASEGATAGFSTGAPAAPWDAALFDQALAVNLRAPLQLALLAAERAPMLAAIVNVGSGSAARGDGSSSYYVLSKGSIPVLTEYLARRLAPRVRVNALLAGLIDTEEIRGRGPAFQPRVDGILHRTPMGRMGKPQEMAEVIAFLLAGAGFITGSTVTLDGAWHL